MTERKHAPSCRGEHIKHRLCVVAADRAGSDQGDIGTCRNTDLLLRTGIIPVREINIQAVAGLSQTIHAVHSRSCYSGTSAEEDRLIASVRIALTSSCVREDTDASRKDLPFSTTTFMTSMPLLLCA